MSALSHAVLAVTASPSYSRWMYCSVTVRGVNGGVPALNFTSFSTDFLSDFVQLFDGNSTLAPLLGKYSGVWQAYHLIVGAPGGSGV